MKKILVLYAHPAKSKSKINKELILSIKGLEGVTIHDLYSTYPDFMIDVKKEQKLCEEHDIIIFQYPFYWYSSPAILKEWQDLVLEHSWAYGSKGNALKGKIFTMALTAGADDFAYSLEGLNKKTLDELLSPFETMSQLCKMKYIRPFTVTGIHRGLPQQEIRLYSENYRRFITLLRDDRLDLAKLSQYTNYTKHIDELAMEVE